MYTLFTKFLKNHTFFKGMTAGSFIILQTRNNWTNAKRRPNKYNILQENKTWKIRKKRKKINKRSTDLNESANFWFVQTYISKKRSSTVGKKYARVQHDSEAASEGSPYLGRGAF